MSSTLPAEFSFSQSSLQDYVDCPRRFELRYILRQAWPAVQAQPVIEHERQIWRGMAFHRLVHQLAVGIPLEALGDSISDDELFRWWRSYLDNPPQDLPARVRLTEVSLRTFVGEYRLVAKYDLLTADAERVVIVDWKTGTHRPASTWLARRLQSRVYPYVVVEAGAGALNMPTIVPAQVSMVYWFPEFPHQSAVLEYRGAAHTENRDYLAGLIAEIASRAPGGFPLTDDMRACRFCVYRSLCERDMAAGHSDEMEEVDADSNWTDLDIDLENVTEIAY